MIRKSILIADDATSLRQVVDFKLRLSGYRTLLASTLDEAMEYLKKEPIDLILLDILFEGEKLNGLDFLSLLKENPHFSKIPVIILTILKNPHAREQARRYGARDFITKPFSIRTLLDSIQRNLS